jgi:hypothetical protein
MAQLPAAPYDHHNAEMANEHVEAIIKEHGDEIDSMSIASRLNIAAVHSRLAIADALDRLILVVQEHP